MFETFEEAAAAVGEMFTAAFQTAGRTCLGSLEYGTCS